MDDFSVFDKQKNDDAISAICDYFDDKGLNLFERWHVCWALECSLKAMMGEHLRELCENLDQRYLSQPLPSTSDTSL